MGRVIPGRQGLGVGHPVSQAEELADFPAFVPALIYFRTALIREAERVFVYSNQLDHHVGCFHQDVFPFWFMFEPSISLKDANSVT
jgi:hypothetical protein